MTEVLNVQGDIAAAKTGGYLQIPFTVAPGQTGIQVRYSYDQQGDGTGPDPMGKCTGSGNTLDMGVYQPKADGSAPIWEQSDRRGWSGSAVKNLAISENGFSDETTYNTNRKAFVDGRTTRAYEPGPIQPGEWAVELGIAYVAPDSAADTNGIHYHVQVLQSNDPTWSDHAYVPSGPAGGVGQLDPRLVHRRPARARRDGAGQRDHERDLRCRVRHRRRRARLHHPRRPQQQRRPRRHEGPGRRLPEQPGHPRHRGDDLPRPLEQPGQQRTSPTSGPAPSTGRAR